MIDALVDLHSGDLHLFPDFLLRLASERPLELFPSAGISPSGYSRLPIGLLSAVAGDGLLADRDRSLCVFPRHDEKSPF